MNKYIETELLRLYPQKIVFLLEEYYPKLFLKLLRHALSQKKSYKTILHSLGFEFWNLSQMYAELSFHPSKKIQKSDINSKLLNRMYSFCKYHTITLESLLTKLGFELTNTRAIFPQKNTLSDELKNLETQTTQKLLALYPHKKIFSLKAKNPQLFSDLLKLANSKNTSIPKLLSLLGFEYYNIQNTVIKLELLFPNKKIEHLQNIDHSLYIIMRRFAKAHNMSMYEYCSFLGYKFIGQEERLACYKSKKEKSLLSIKKELNILYPQKIIFLLKENHPKLYDEICFCARAKYCGVEAFLNSIGFDYWKISKTLSKLYTHYPDKVVHHMRRTDVNMENGLRSFSRTHNIKLEKILETLGFSKMSARQYYCTKKSKL